MTIASFLPLCDSLLAFLGKSVITTTAYCIQNRQARGGCIKRSLLPFPRRKLVLQNFRQIFIHLKFLFRYTLIGRTLATWFSPREFPKTFDSGTFLVIAKNADICLCNGYQGCQVGIFKAKFQKCGLFWSGLAWKNCFWHVRHSLELFWPFLMLLAWKNIVWHFLEPLA